jgi:hypothetical protein
VWFPPLVTGATTGAVGKHANWLKLVKRGEIIPKLCGGLLLREEHVRYGGLARIKMGLLACCKTRPNGVPSINQGVFRGNTGLESAEHQITKTRCRETNLFPGIDNGSVCHDAVGGFSIRPEHWRLSLNSPLLLHYCRQQVECPFLILVNTVPPTQVMTT